MKRVLGFVGGVAILIALAWVADLTRTQITAVAIFSSLIFATLFFWSYRLSFAFLALCVLLGTGLLDLPHFIEFAHMDIIMFLVAMMSVVGYLEERRFFEQVI